jgi:hypothetical protein
MPLTKVSFSVIQVANNVTSTTVGNTTSIPSITFDQNGVISAVSNVTPSIANTQITGTIIGSQISANTLANSVFQTGSVENYMRAQGSSVFSGMRNRIINGAMQIDQRNAGANTVLDSGTTRTLDRWTLYSALSSKFSCQQDSSANTVAGFANSMKIVSLAATTPGTEDVYLVRQYVEGYNVADLRWGTANAKSITLSFWVRSSLTGTHGGAIKNDSGEYSYPFTYTISSANTWEQKIITIPGPTIGTWNTTNGIGISLVFSLGSGSVYSGAAGSWTNNSYFSATGVTNVIGTNGATWYITGVQLEAGSSSTPFEYRHYGTEYNLCLRYFWRSVGPYSAANGQIAAGMQYNGGDVRAVLHHPVPMRGVPAVTFSGSGFGFERPGLSYGTIGTPYSANMTPYATLLYSTGSTSAGMSNGYATVWGFTNDTTSISVSAEL